MLSDDADRASTPTHVAVESGQVWFATTDTIWRLDPAVGTPVKIEAVGYVHDLVGLGGKIYVARDGEKLLEGFVVPYDARNGTRADGVSILACSMAASPALGLWAAGCPNVQQLRIEPNRITKGRLVIVPVPRADDGRERASVPLRDDDGRGLRLGRRRRGRPAGVPHRPERPPHRRRDASGRAARNRVRRRLALGQRSARRRRPADRPRDEPRCRPGRRGTGSRRPRGRAGRPLGGAPRRRSTSSASTRSAAASSRRSTSTGTRTRSRPPATSSGWRAMRAELATAGSRGGDPGSRASRHRRAAPSASRCASA